MLIDEFLCKREVLGKRAPHSFTPPLSVVGVSNILERLPLIILGIPSSDPHNTHNLYTKTNKAG
jgi:hypothetical protein